ncbi:cysteine desulfurase family protein [Erysipelotrichaceae bacterium 51-3]|uniref:cysteine desulfurase family protein n=1 Tax=Allobaculum sp. JKK-2023 TaxID=3108943 RepID=UPI002B059641|nr:cysteine desulfurase family protein [Allobaculum sp. JKK-2023]
MIYFDNAATTPVNQEVAALFVKLLGEYGNPDSLHQLGRKSHRLLEESRTRIASMLEAKPEEILFTSCASESNSMAVVGYALANQHRGKRIITSNSEHSSTTAAMNYLESLGFEIVRLPIQSDGRVHPEDVQAAMTKDTILVSLLHVSNEMGAITDIKAIADIVHQHPTAAFHADCTQSFGKLEIPFTDLDLMTMSAHKIHGMKGSALLKKKKNIVLQPLIFGGQQEQGLRGGTENAPVHIALAKTIRLALSNQKKNMKQIQAVRDRILERLPEIGGVKVLSPADASPTILCLCFESMTSQVLQNALDEKGICVSAISTCESRHAGANPVLVNMGCTPKEATHNIRLSFGEDNTIQQADQFIDTVKEIVNAYGLPL